LNSLQILIVTELRSSISLMFSANCFVSNISFLSSHILCSYSGYYNGDYLWNVTANEFDVL
jgi:hypothetical protein